MAHALNVRSYVGPFGPLMAQPPNLTSLRKLQYTSACSYALYAFAFHGLACYNYSGVILLHKFEGGMPSNMYTRKLPQKLDYNDYFLEYTPMGISVWKSLEGLNSGGVRKCYRPMGKSGRKSCQGLNSGRLRKIRQYLKKFRFCLPSCHFQ